MVIKKNDERYFKWLLKFINFNDKNYNKLLMKLHNTTFTYISKSNDILSRDSCREDDGMELRFDFIKDFKSNITNIEGECSLLEMLIGLARRMDDLLNYKDIPKINIYFNILLENLNLLYYDDINYNEEKINKIIDIFLNRKYDKNGNGGLFPIEKYNGDMRKIDIAMQMFHYLNANEYY